MTIIQKVSLIEKFFDDLKQAVIRDSNFITVTLSNVFTMREIGNKTHGDLAEVALVEFINKQMDGYTANHVGKSQFRSKKSEEDIIIATSDKSEFSISLKAYGIGSLQLSTNKDSSMFRLLTKVIGESSLIDVSKIRDILSQSAFEDFFKINVLPLIYDEKTYKFNITTFDSKLAYASVAKIVFEGPDSKSKRKHPVYRFYTADNKYIFEVRYGGTTANALQRGMWTHTVNANDFFKDITGWQTYSINRTLLELIPKILNSNETKHKQIDRIL